MRRNRQILPTLTILAGAGLLIAGVYRAVPAALGMAGVVALFAGGIWALRRSSVDRRALAAAHWGSADGAGDLPHGHHGGGHHGGFDGGGGGGFFDGGGGGHGGGGHGGH